MIRLAETRLSWCVMLILVGEGQEIHSGEGGGISLWCEALRTHHKNWEILCPEKLYPLLQKNTDHAVFSYKEFNLDTSLRSHIASDVSTYINHRVMTSRAAIKRLKASHDNEKQVRLPF